ncbi:hypothetical protein BJAS_P4316 [Bathymodiolus japonicus methanotrophic gill symbiont]|uniref:hypothetical protein n=1 Tax=Bathymodiolus japonicus methanotrophic gill symbiont TaxID=113269 RepID=UPI001B449A13|nr:hypothetical protein [Bathymodiolus japonicus methanotrophic gill symbiont]GFO73489.1 hypothetical protein BJAS_P4316 [Bathymodiolus japonicus methanotrophic gill symbiont]
MEKEIFTNDSECRKCLEPLQREFEGYLARNFSPRTARKQTTIIGLFIEFLCFDCALKNSDEITVGMANSYFRRWYVSKIGDATESELKTVIKKFFVFLDQEMGIRNEKVLCSFKRK